MKKRILVTRHTLLTVFLLILLLGANLWAQDEGDAWLKGVESQLLELSLNVEEFVADSFFDVFVEAVLREGLPPDITDPELGTALSSEEVTEIIREGGQALFEALPRIQNPLDPTLPVVFTPGAAVHKYDPEGRWSSGPHRFAIFTRAQVNQWIRASMRTSRIVWKILKPGAYSTDSMYLNLHSNGNLRVVLENFGPLQRTNPDGTIAGEIQTLYTLSSYVQTQPNQVFPGVTTAGAAQILPWVPDGASATALIGPHTLLKVWNAINVDSNAGPGLYETPNSPSAVLTVIAAGL